MWKSIADVLVSGNGIVITLLLATLIVVCSKYGLLKIKTDKITIGRDSSDMERNIVRLQIDYVTRAARAAERHMPKPDEYDKYRGRFIVNEIILEFTDLITQNHIRANPTYIARAQGRIWELTQTLVDKEEFQSEEFKELIDEFIKNTITELVQIRKEYSKE